jgi:hypothetical protein
MENVMGMIKNESAQFMLLAGFIIAIGLVITTAMLNNIIFESNMAGEAGGDPIKYDIVNLMRISGDEMKSAYRDATNVSAPKNNMITNFTIQMNDFSANLPKIYALHGEGVNISWDVNNWNKDLYANFTETGTATGAANWIVIQNVNKSNITVYITSGTFCINITNTTSFWNITLPAGYNSFNNTNISSKVLPPYSITFLNGANAAGSYNINGTASSITFIRARDYILYSTVTLSTSNMRANITIPVSVPW